MNSSTALNLLEDCKALLRGHFQLTSGLHTDTYVECAKALADPGRAAELGEALYEMYKEQSIDAVVAPALGGLIIGYEVARAAGVPFAFCERGEQGQYAFRRGFSFMPGDRLLIVDDVLTAQTPVPELVEILSNAGAVPIGVAAIICRGDAPQDIGIRTKSLIELSVVTYPAGDCPLCRQGVVLESMERSAV